MKRTLTLYFLTGFSFLLLPAQDPFFIGSVVEPVLYKECLNKIQIFNLSKGIKESIEVSSKEATCEPARQPGEFYVIPHERNISFDIWQQGKLVIQKQLKVRTIPAPDVMVLADYKKTANRAFLSKDARCLVLLQPESSFAEKCPQDARYHISSLYVYLVRAKRAVSSRHFSSGEFQLSEFPSAQSGDRLLIELDSTSRQNYRGQKESSGVLPGFVFEGIIR